MEFSEAVPGRAEWILIRQALASALRSGKEISLDTGGLETDGKYSPFFADIREFVSSFKCGELTAGQGRVEFSPGTLVPGIYNTKVSPFSSPVELYLFLLPALLYLEARTVLNFTGATHCPYSHSTSFIKESFLPLLENRGLYSSFLLKRFAFYGHGGGQCEARVYPAEARVWDMPACLQNPQIAGCKIFFAGIAAQAAEYERNMLCALLGLSQSNFTLMDVRACDGPGNSIQFFIKDENFPGAHFVLSRDIPILSFTAEHLPDEKAFGETLESLAAEVQSLLETKNLPLALPRELAPLL